MITSFFNGRVARTTYEHVHVSVILGIRPTLTTPKTVACPQKSGKLADQLQEWINSGWSLSQIAEDLGASKTWVVGRVQRYCIKVPKKGRMTNPENYRHHVPPFGFRKNGNRLYPCQKQQRVCRKVVQWRQKENLSFNAIAKRLKGEGALNSRSGTYWDHKATKKIFETWKDKY